MKNHMAVTLFGCSLGLLILSTYSFPVPRITPAKEAPTSIIHNVTNKTDDIAARNIYMKFQGEEQKLIFFRDIGNVLDDRAKNIPQKKEE